MKLTTANGSIENPSIAQIRETLYGLDTQNNTFAILAQDEMTYLQTSGSPENGFVLEYQEGSMDRHFRASGPLVPIEKVHEAFGDYLTQNSKWRSRFEWELEEVGASSGCGSSVLIWALVSGSIVASRWLIA